MLPRKIELARAWALVGLVSMGLACHSGSKEVVSTAIGKVCAKNSDCDNPLACVYTKCRVACQESRDCQPGLLCLPEKMTGVKACQLVAEKNCYLNTDCPADLVCAIDRQCRVECVGDRDCAGKQICAIGDVCADIDEVVDPVANRTLKMDQTRPVHATDGGADACGVDADVGSGDGGAPDSDGPTPDAGPPARMIYVDLTGNDSAPGGVGTPVRTLTQAAKLAQAGDIVTLAAGDYSMATGEDFTTAARPPLPDGVTVAGDPAGGTRLVNTGRTNDGLVFAGSATVKDISISGFANAVHVNRGGTVTLENLKVTGCAKGVTIDGMAQGAMVIVQGAGSSFTDDTASGSPMFNIAAPMASLVVRGGVNLVQNSSAVFSSQGARSSITLQDATVVLRAATMVVTYAAEITVRFERVAVRYPDAYGGHAITLTTEAISLDVIDSSFTGLIGMVGGFVQVSGTNAKVNVTGTMFEGGQIQVEIGSGAQGKVRRCRFTNFSSYGVQVIGQGDLGTRADPGMNVFTSVTAQEGFGVFDIQPAGQPGPLPCVGNTFNGEMPTGIITRTATVNPSVAGKYFIYNVGNSIEL